MERLEPHIVSWNHVRVGMTSMGFLNSQRSNFVCRLVWTSCGYVMFYSYQEDIMWLLSVLRHMAAGKPVTRGMTSIGDHNCHSLGCYHIICPDQEVLISTRGTTMKSGYWEQMTIASTQQQSTDAMRSWRIWMFDGIMQRLNYLSTSSSSNDANVEFSLRGCSKMKSSLWGGTQTPSLFPLVIMSSFGYPPSLVHA